MLFYLRFVVITLYFRMISYWYVFLFWHRLGCYNVRKKTELLTKGRPKLQYHADCIAHYSFLHEMPNKTNRLQPCACNAPLAYIYIYLRSVSMSACLSDCRSCSAPTSHHPCLESWQMKVHISGKVLVIFSKTYNSYGHLLCHFICARYVKKCNSYLAIMIIYRLCPFNLKIKIKNIPHFVLSDKPESRITVGTLWWY